jgi:hypothetical protein
MLMFNYIDELLKECPDDLMKGVSSSGAAAHLYNMNNDAEKLDAETAILYHHLTAKFVQTNTPRHTKASIILGYLCQMPGHGQLEGAWLVLAISL